MDGLIAGPGMRPSPQGSDTAAPHETDIEIGGMACASCVARVERALKRVPGVTAAEVNLATERALIRTVSDVPTDRLLTAVRDAGYEAAPIQADAPTPVEDRHGRELLHVIAAAALSAPLLLGMAGHLFGGNGCCRGGCSSRWRRRGSVQRLGGRR